MQRTTWGRKWGYVKFSTRSHCDVIRVYDAADNLIEMPE